MEEYNANEFRALLEASLQVMAQMDVRDYSIFIDDKTLGWNSAQKAKFIENECAYWVAHPDYDYHVRQREIHSMTLDRLAESQNLWEQSQRFGLSSKFVSKHPFLINTLAGMVAAGKVELLYHLLAPESMPAKPLPTFSSLFLSDESMERALAAAEKVEMVTRNGEVIVWTKKWDIGSIPIFWEYLSGMNPPMVDTDIDYRIAADVIANRFGKTISDRAKRGTPAYREEFKKALKVAL